MNYEKLVQDVIDEHKGRPDVLGIGDTDGEYHYLTCHQQEYIRTVSDVDGLYASNRDAVSVLEIGSFLGAVS